MTVSVGTGHTEYWPLYASIGNIHNSVRRAHGSGLVLRSCTLMYNLYKITEASTLKEIKRGVFEVFQRRLRVANWEWSFQDG